MSDPNISAGVSLETGDLLIGDAFIDRLKASLAAKIPDDPGNIMVATIVKPMLPTVYEYLDSMREDEGLRTYIHDMLFGLFWDIFGPELEPRMLPAGKLGATPETELEGEEGDHDNAIDKLADKA